MPNDLNQSRHNKQTTNQVNKSRHFSFSDLLVIGITNRKIFHCVTLEDIQIFLKSEINLGSLVISHLTEFVIDWCRVSLFVYFFAILSLISECLLITKGVMFTLRCLFERINCRNKQKHMPYKSLMTDITLFK